MTTAEWTGWNINLRYNVTSEKRKLLLHDIFRLRSFKTIMVVFCFSLFYIAIFSL